MCVSCEKASGISIGSCPSDSGLTGHALTPTCDKRADYNDTVFSKWGAWAWGRGRGSGGGRGGRQIQENLAGADCRVQEQGEHRTESKRWECRRGNYDEGMQSRRGEVGRGMEGGTRNKGVSSMSIKGGVQG